MALSMNKSKYSILLQFDLNFNWENGPKMAFLINYLKNKHVTFIYKYFIKPSLYI